MKGLASLLAGRNTAPLGERQVRSVFEFAYGLDRSASLRHDPNARTVFRVYPDDEGNEQCEIVFGPDLYPGNSVADPNSILSWKCAIAHELSHKSRYENGTEINEESLAHLDEALTSLGAIARFSSQLDQFDYLQLVADAVQRIQLFVADYRNSMAEQASREPPATDAQTGE